MKHTRYSVMYCHNFDCDEYNRRQEIALIPATWEQPAELTTDSCPYCGGYLEPEPRDHERFVDRIAYALDDITTEAQRKMASACEKAMVDNDLLPF